MLALKSPFKGRNKIFEHSFTVINSYRKWIFKQTLESFQSLGVISKVANASHQNRIYILKIPFEREQGKKLIKSISNIVNRILSNNYQPSYICN